jgi:glucokinase
MACFNLAKDGPMSRVIVGDAGGTNVRFGIAESEADGLVIHSFQKFVGANYDSFYDALAHYVEITKFPLSETAAVFALAGPVDDGTVSLTNRDWTVSSDELMRRFGMLSVDLFNDFAAMARAVPELNRSTFDTIKNGVAQPDAPIIVAGPGTGFGVATLLHNKKGWRVLSGEGGYTAYAPVTPIECALAAHLRSIYGFVSTELICAGIGFTSVHKALCEIMDIKYVPTHASDAATLAAAGNDLFRELCAIRARGTMSAVGDLVLINGAKGGVVLAGGVSEHIATYLKSPDALSRFTDRGLKSDYMAHVPVQLMKDPIAPLIGAAALHLKDM